MSQEALLIATLLLPFIAALLIATLGHHERLRDALVLGMPLVLLGIVTQFFLLPRDDYPALTLIEIVPDLSLHFQLEPLGLLFAGVVALLWPIASLYSIGYLKGNKEKHQTRFHSCFALSIGCAMGVASAGNLLTLFVAYEMLTLATYPLVVHKGDRNAMHGGRVYLAVLLFSSIGLFLPAILWIWHLTGNLAFTPGGVLGGVAMDDSLLTLLLLLSSYGIGKAALMPLHRWLPAAMVAPTPVSALLHAVAVVKAGVFSILKVMIYIFGTERLTQISGSDWVFGIAAATIVIASIIALRQDNLKRRLAYSTISQLSYVVMGTFILAPLSLAGAALHIAAHAFGKITLFFAAGSIYTASHKTHISELAGVGWRMPWTMGAFTIGALSMIGIPPLAGFLSKWYLLLGAWQMENLLAMLVITLSTLLNTAYFVPIIYTAWFRPANDDQDPHGEAPLAIVISLSLTALLTLTLFSWTEIPLDLIAAIPGVTL